jgi:anti-sigma factor RsiW
MNHKKYQVLVSSFVDDEVNESELAAVHSHLEQCPECRQFIEHAKHMREEICALGEGVLEHSFASRVASAVEKRDEQTVEWLGIEPSARNTFILLSSIVILLFFLTGFNETTASPLNDQLINRITSDSTSHVLLQQEYISKSDVLYAVMTK